MAAKTQAMIARENLEFGHSPLERTGKQAACFKKMYNKSSLISHVYYPILILHMVRGAALPAEVLGYHI